MSHPVRRRDIVLRGALAGAMPTVAIGCGPVAFGAAAAETRALLRSLARGGTVRARSRRTGIPGESSTATAITDAVYDCAGSALSGASGEPSGEGTMNGAAISPVVTTAATN